MISNTLNSGKTNSLWFGLAGKIVENKKQCCCLEKQKLDC